MATRIKAKDIIIVSGILKLRQSKIEIHKQKRSKKQNLTVLMKLISILGDKMYMSNNL